MKTNRWSIVTLLLVGTAGLASAQCAGPLSYSIPIVPGFNLVANQVNCGGNTLPEIMPLVPDGTVCSVFNNTTKSFQVANYIDGFGWDVPLVLRPGAGAFLQSPVAFLLTLRGSPNVPVLPVPLAAGACCILSRQTNAIGTYETIVGAPPAEGTTLYRWNEPTQSYEVFTYDLGAWTPFVPTAAVGEAIVICRPSSAITLCGTQAKWSQLPGYRVFTNSPTMRGGDRPSDVDWKTLMAAGTNLVDPNWIIADDFRSDGRPILTVRWWGSYLSAAANGFEDGYVLSFFSDVPTNIGPAGGFSRPGNLLGTYVAPVEAVRRRETQHIGWDGLPIYQYEVNLKDTCLDHAVSGLATPRAFLEQSNIIYWLAITAEVGHRIVAVTNAAGQVIDWVQTQTNKRATNHFWGWHTSPTNRLDLSVMGHLFMPTPTNWSYPSNQWRPNQPFHMELDQAFELLTCDTNPPFIVDIDISCESNKLVVRFNEPVDPASATVPANYSMQALSATLIDANTVCVLFPPCQTNYWVLIHNIADTCGNVMPVGIDFHPICPPCSTPKIAKWTQLPGYLVFTNAGQNPNMHGGDRYSDVDWVTLMQAGTNLVQPNWVIADDFRSDGRPILCVRWWGSYRPGFEPTSTGTVFEDGYVLSFFSDFRPLTGGPSRPNQLLGTYVAPVNAVKVTRTPFIGWDSNRIYQYEVALEDTCLDHASPNIARPNAFLEVSNTVYWLAVTAEVGHRVVPITNATGQVVDWIQTQTNKRATDHFWGWHTAPTNREDLSVMGHVYMLSGTNWLYPTNQWMPNQPFHMEFDQAFQLLTGCDTNPPRITNFNFSCDTLKLIVEFNDALDPASVTDLNNYGGPGIVSSVILVDNHIVCVNLSPAPCNTLFGLCITGIRDVCGNVMSPGICIDFFCPCRPVEKLTKWDQLPGYLVFTNAGQNPDMHGGDRPSDVDWLTLLQGGTNILQPNWVIADNFRSDGRPIVCVRWWGSYLPGVQAGFEDGFVLSFFANFPVPVGAFNRPGQLLGSYVAPKTAVKVTATGFIGWDSNRIYQYEVALEDTCLDHAVPGLATPGAFLEQSNIVYWLAITAQVGCRVIPLTNDCGAVIDWVQTFSEKRATNHFWGWHTSPTNRLDPSVMGHLLMPGTNWIYPTNMWMVNESFHMERDQAFVLLTTNRPPNPKRVKWSQPPGWVVFTNSPQMHGGDRFSDVDWVTLMQNPTAFVQPNWVIADDFRSDGRPILAVRWWGSYPRTVTPGFEDGFVLSFFSDFRPAAGGPSRPDQLLGSYVAPRSAVRASLTPYIGWDSNCIYQYEVNLRDTCLDHAVAGLATPRAFLERSNIVYWVAITAEVGHRVVPIRNAAGLIVDWQQVTTGKRATNHYWGWHTSPIQREDISVMGHVLMAGTNWIFPIGQWQTNATFHMELDQAFELLTCPLPPALRIVRMGANAEISWDGDGFRLQAVPSLDPPGPPYPWADLADDSPVVVPMVGPHRFFRAICP